MPRKELEHILEIIRHELDDSDTNSEEGIRQLRERIDALDRGILELLNERSKSANIIGRIKKQLGLPVYAPNREEEVLDQVREANQGPLPDASVKRLFERIIDETRALERQRYQNEPDRDHA